MRMNCVWTYTTYLNGFRQHSPASLDSRWAGKVHTNGEAKQSDDKGETVY